MFLSVGIMYAQGDRHHNTSASSGHYDYDSYEGGVTYSSYHGSSNRYNGDDNRGRNNDSYYRNGNRGYYDRYLSRMTRRDRKCLRDLTDKLEHTKRKAWSDGYLSRRDKNRIGDVQNDIDRLISKYHRRSDRRSYISGRSSCR